MSKANKAAEPETATFLPAPPDAPSSITDLAAYRAANLKERRKLLRKAGGPIAKVELRPEDSVGLDLDRVRDMVLSLRSHIRDGKTSPQFVIGALERIMENLEAVSQKAEALRIKYCKAKKKLKKRA